MEHPKTVIFFGPQGSGKGTQRTLLHEYFSQNNESVLAYETGKDFRSIVSRGGFAAQRIQELINQGHILPYFLPVILWGSAFLEELDERTHLFIDGSPRSAREAEVLEEAFSFFRREQVDVIHLTLSEEEAVRRLSARGRDDDTPAAIKKRLQLYREQTEPLLSFFSDHSRYHIHEIDGSLTIEEIHLDVKNRVMK